MKFDSKFIQIACNIESISEGLIYEVLYALDEEGNVWSLVDNCKGELPNKWSLMTTKREKYTEL